MFGSSNYLGALPFEQLPAPSASYRGMVVYCTNIGPGVAGASGGCPMEVNRAGTRWIPLFGAQEMETLDADVIHAAASAEAIDLQSYFPAGSLAVGDCFEFSGAGIKGLMGDGVRGAGTGLTDTLRVYLRMGTTGTTGDTAIVNAAVGMTAANVQGFLGYGFSLDSSTLAQRYGSSGNQGSIYTAPVSNGQPAPVALGFTATSAACYVSAGLAGGATVDSCTLRAGAKLIWRAPR